MDTTRREFIRLTVSFALLSLGGRVSAGEVSLQLPNDDEKMLTDIVYQLFPHPRLSKDVYTQVTTQLRERIAQSVELTAMLDEAMGVLAGDSRNTWAALPASEKLAALEQIEHTPFFQFVRNETLGGVYRHPLVWELLGYEGSSLEFGGYINRGLNDIDWLPA